MRIGRPSFRSDTIGMMLASMGSKRTFVSFTILVLILMLLNIPLPFSTKIEYIETADEDRDSGIKKDRDIDVISIGSMQNPHLQQAQKKTFGSHAKIRNFFEVTELDDTDATCHKDLTVDKVKDAIQFCKNTKGQSRDSTMMRQKLRFFSEHKNSPGWMCAQKRPMDGLRVAFEWYKHDGPPKYLVIVDDDTYINMDALVEMLQLTYPPDQATVLGGCIFTFPRELNFTFPVGGFGSILTRKTVENLMRPIHCDNEQLDGFSRMACWRLDQNLVGEKRFFTEGMSVADLMVRYSAELPFTNIEKWIDGHGFCFHSDHALGYFIGYYHVWATDALLDASPASDVLRMNNPYLSYSNVASGKQCQYEKNKCDANAMICHYVNPDQMSQLYTGQEPSSA